MAAEGITREHGGAAVSLREVAGGVTGAIFTIAIQLAVGTLAFTPLGATAAEAGIPAAFTAIAIGGLIVAFRADSIMPAAAPTAVLALIVAAVVAEFAADPFVRIAERSGLATMLCAVALSVIGMGFVQIAFAALRLATIQKFVPHSVIAGFMCAIAIMIVLSQLPALLGVMPGVWHADRGVLSSLQPAALATGLATAAIAGLVARRRPHAHPPAALVGLIAGTLVDAVLRYGSVGIAAGGLTGFVPALLPLPIALEPLLGGESTAILYRHLPAILTASVVLAIVGSQESMLGAKATDDQTGRQHDANADLLAIGLGNVAAGFFGGLPIGYVRARAAAILGAGGQTWRAAAIAAVASWILYMIAAPLLGSLPLAVIAGILLVVAVGIVDRWTRQLLFQLVFRSRTRDTWTSVAIAAILAGVTLWLGFAAGIAAGVLVSMLVFMRAMNRSLIRSRYTAVAQPSRRVYSRAQEDELRPLRRQISIINLDGTLFFGNADRLLHKCESLPDPTRYVIVDLSRVTSVDTTGATALVRLGERLAGRSIRLLLAGVSTGNRHGRVLLSLGSEMYDLTRRWFADADHAVEAAERGLLGSTLAATTVATVPFEDSALVAGLTSREIAVVRAHTKERKIAAHDTLFREGDVGNELFVLTRGSVTLLYVGDGNSSRQRYVSYSPGMMFGEVALLDSVGRTADAVADVESVVHELTRAGLDALHATDPALSARVYANIAAHLAERLRTAAGAWSAAVR
jgi:MFS superfamily sulfate permease-like transporter/CRP-like cAMP-binding protein